MSEPIVDPAVQLAAQLATDNKLLDKDLYDYDILSDIKHSTDHPDTFKPVLYFGTVKRILHAYETDQPISFVEAMDDAYLRRTISIQGKGRRFLLYVVQVLKGIGINMGREIPKPTGYDKLFRRDVVKQYEQQQAESLDLE